MLIEIGIGLILVGLFLYTLGVVLFLDRGLLAMGNVSLCYDKVLDVILEWGSCSDRSTQYYDVFRQEIETSRQCLLFPGFPYDSDWLVPLHSAWLPCLDVWTLPTIQIFHLNDIRLLPDSPSHWPLPKQVSCHQASSEQNRRE